MDEKIMQRVIKSFEKIDVYIDLELNEFLEAKDYIDSSLQFIKLIVQLEEEFDIEIPDNYILFENFETFQKICNIIEKIL